MKQVFYILFGVVLLASCQQEEKILVTGTIKNYDPSTSVKEVYMFKLNPQNFSRIDTAYVQENGVFKFNIAKLPSDLYAIGPVQNNAVTVYVDSGSKQEQNITINNQAKWIMDYESQGNDVTNAVESFNKTVNKFLSFADKLTKERATLGFNDTIKEKELRTEFLAAQTSFKAKRDEFIQQYMASPALAVVMGHIDPRTEMDLLKRVINEGLANSIPKSNFYLNSKKYIGKLETELAEKERLKNLLKSGTPAPELAFPGVDNTLVKLSDLKGKIVLIDFWASWCRPCRAENPNVVKLYNKYKNSGFDIYSFSLDKNKDRWIQAIAADGLTWKSHSSDLKGWQTAAIPIYNFNSIPFTVLIDKNGNVIAKNLRGPALEKQLNQIFGF